MAGSPPPLDFFSRRNSPLVARSGGGGGGGSAERARGARRWQCAEAGGRACRGASAEELELLEECVGYYVSAWIWRE